ncbi:MAG: acyl-CoA thioesterase, partial [Calditrichia bacterium]
EAFMTTLGFGIQTIISQSPYSLPIVHAEADYFIPSTVGDRITVQLQVESISKNPFQIIYDFINEFGKIAGNAKTVHVAVDKKKQTKMALPEDLVNALREYSSEEE